VNAQPQNGAANGGGSGSRIAEITGVGVKTLIIAGATGAGGVLGLAIMELVHSQPQMVLGIFREWGPLAAIVMVGMFVVDRRMGENNRVQLQAAASMQSLSESVSRLAERDDREAEHQRTLLNYVGAQMEKILEEFSELKCRSAKA
jgi:hypothetical protein